MSLPGRKQLPHGIPPWIDPDASDYFITVCCQQRGTNQLCLSKVGDVILSTVRFYQNQQKWFPSLFLLMPDHPHMIVAFGRDQEMTKVVSAWKRYTATQHGILWQRDFFEHRLRGNESWEEKAAYVLNNPVRAGLAANASEWPFVLRAA